MAVVRLTLTSKEVIMRMSCAVEGQGGMAGLVGKQERWGGSMAPAHSRRLAAALSHPEQVITVAVQLDVDVILRVLHTTGGPDSVSAATRGAMDPLRHDPQRHSPRWQPRAAALPTWIYSPSASSFS